MGGEVRVIVMRALQNNGFFRSNRWQNHLGESYEVILFKVKYTLWPVPKQAQQWVTKDVTFKEKLLTYSHASLSAS